VAVGDQTGSEHLRYDGTEWVESTEAVGFVPAEPVLPENAPGEMRLEDQSVQGSGADFQSIGTAAAAAAAD